LVQGEFNWDETPEPEPEPAPERPRKLTIDERFELFCAQHSDVLSLFERFAKELRASGYTKLGSKLIWERIRWERMTSAHGTETPALNNIFTSRISRWLVERDPSFKGCFETRRLKSRPKTAGESEE